VTGLTGTLSRGIETHIGTLEYVLWPLHLKPLTG
jgi:hypothetical protein